jgi:hypothetical protein
MLDRLLTSIKEYAPDIKIDVLDDSDTNIGISAGRNQLVARCKTKYCMILDDDCIFTPKTNLEKAIKILEERDLDLLEIQVPGLNYRGHFKIKNDEIEAVQANEGEYFDFITNIFVAKTDVLRKYKWDDRMKIGEHTSYFFTHRGKMKIGTTDQVTIRHEHVSPPGYNIYRSRGEDYVKIFMRENGIKRLHTVTGEYIVV